MTSRFSYHYQTTADRSVLSQFLCQSSRIHTVNSWNVVVTEPLGETLLCRPVRMLPRIGTDHQSRNVDTIALKVFGQIVLVANAFVGDTVVSDQGISQDKNLTTVRRIRQGFGVTDHARVEDHFSVNGNGRPKGTSFDRVASICQIQKGRISLKLIKTIGWLSLENELVHYRRKWMQCKFWIK